MTKEDPLGSDEIEKMRKIQNASRFVDEALFPYIALSRPYKDWPTVEDVEALIWGYQSGNNEELSIPDVGDVIRRRISEAEQSRDIFHYSASHAIRALKTVEEALPLVATHFSDRKNVYPNKQDESVSQVENVSEARLGFRSRFIRAIARFKNNRNVR